MRDNILNFKHLQGETIYELWLRFKTLELQCQTYGIADKMVLDYFYKSTDPENRGVTDQRFSGCIM